jgi:hypothetical protein
LLSAEPTDTELEFAKLRMIFEANVRSKLERWEVEKGIQTDGIKLEALGITPALMNSFVVGEVEGEATWTLEAFLGWFSNQKEAEEAATAVAAAAEAAAEAAAKAQREVEREERERQAADDAARNARQSQEKALIARLSLYDVDSDEEDAEAMSRNRVAEVSRWDAKDVRATATACVPRCVPFEIPVGKILEHSMRAQQTRRHRFSHYHMQSLEMTFL